MTGKDGRTASTQPHAVGLGAGKDRKSSGSGGPLRRAAPAAVAVLTYCVVAAAAYWPVSPVSSSRIMVCGCHDAAQEAWFLAWPLFAITHSHSLFFSNWIGYPSGVNLAANTSMPLLGVLGAPVTALAGPVASYKPAPPSSSCGGGRPSRRRRSPEGCSMASRPTWWARVSGMSSLSSYRCHR